MIFTCKSNVCAVMLFFYNFSEACLILLHLKGVTSFKAEFISTLRIKTLANIDKLK